MVTTILVIVIIILLAYGLGATIGIIKAMKKTEVYEELFEDIKKKVNTAYVEMKEIDTLGAFEADDDVGDIFKEMKRIVDELNNYITENVNE